MQIEINEEALTYLKGLKSKKKQRKFLLDCMIEQITIGGLAKYKPFETNLWYTVEEDGVKYHWFVEKVDYENYEIIGSGLGKNGTIINLGSVLYKNPKNFNWFLENCKLSDFQIANWPTNIDKTYTEIHAVTLDKNPHILLQNHIKEVEGMIEINMVNRFIEIAEKALIDEDLTLETCQDYKNKAVELKQYELGAKFRLKEKQMIERQKPDGKLLKFDQIDKEEGLKRNFTIGEIVNHVVDESKKELKKEKFTKEDLEKCFNASREYHHEIVEGSLKNKLIFDTFEDYYKSLKK